MREEEREVVSEEEREVVSEVVSDGPFTWISMMAVYVVTSTPARAAAASRSTGRRAKGPRARWRRGGGASLSASEPASSSSASVVEPPSESTSVRLQRSGRHLRTCGEELGGERW